MLPPVFFDRFTMGFSLAVHIVLAATGIALPLMIMAAEFIGIRNSDRFYKVLARRLAVVLIVLFAIGTATGSVVAVELFFLWPKFFQLVANVAILPLYAEVFAFFTEAFFLAMYFYTSRRLENSYWKVFMMGLVGLGAAMSAVFITMINAFMNTPVGFDIPTYLKSGVISAVRPFMVFYSPSAWIQISHVASTAYFAGTFIFLGYFAYRLLEARKKSDKDSETYYRKALNLTVAIVLVATLLSIVTGVLSITQMLHIQPEKYAAIEGNLVPGTYMAENLFNVIKIPDMQSILATGSASGYVPGLSLFPSSTWPPYLILHDMFDLMVLVGFGIGGFVLLVVLAKILRKDPFGNRIVLGLLVIASVFAVILLEDGWVMAEVGRQPWIISNVLTVSAAANSSAAIIPIAIALVIFYAAVIPAAVFLLRKIFSERDIGRDIRGWQ